MEREGEGGKGGGADAFPRLCLFAFRAVAASIIACGSVICKRDKRCTRMCKNVFRFSMVDREFFSFFFFWKKRDERISVRWMNLFYFFIFFSDGKAINAMVSICK